MEKYHVVGVSLVFCVTLWSLLAVADAQNTCIGSGCICTTYPVTVSCINAFIDYVPDHIKQVATEVEVRASSMRSLANMDLSEWLSLDKLTLSVEKGPVCKWIAKQLVRYARIKIKSLLHACLIEKKYELVMQSTHEPEQDDINETSQQDPDQNVKSDITTQTKFLGQFDQTSASYEKLTTGKITLKTRKLPRINKVNPKPTTHQMHSTTSGQTNDVETTTDGHVDFTPEYKRNLIMYVLIGVGSTMLVILTLLIR